MDTDERKDIAILKIKAVNLPVLTVADSDGVKVGATIYTIGAPRGLTGTLSSGIVSSLRSASELSSELIGFRVIQFTAPTSPGSSGGALLDETGKLIGLVFASRRDGQNLNVAVPVNYVAPLVANVKGEGRSLRKMSNFESPRAVARDESTNNINNDVIGVYTGAWSSNEYNASGTLVMTVSKVDDQYLVKAVFTGSDYFNEDILLANITEIGGGVWKMDYKGKKSKITGTGLFKGGKFVGDYKFKKLLLVDKGKWILGK